jgi:hypothetical protein
MHPSHIAQLIREALVHSGCTEAQIGTFDGHSTIELEFVHLPSLNIAVLDSGVWFFSKISEITPDTRRHYADALLGFLMKGFAAARTEQMQINEIDGMLEVRVLLSDDATSSPQSMAAAIEAYIESLDVLRDLLR